MRRSQCSLTCSSAAKRAAMDMTFIRVAEQRKLHCVCSLMIRIVGRSVVWPWLSSFESPAHPVKSLTSTCPAPGAHSRGIPKADPCSATKGARLFDHLVGAGQHGRGNFKAKRFGGLEIDG